MQITDQLDFSKPEHVSVYCKGNKLTIYISGISSSVRLTYELREETDSNEVTYRGPNWCTSPHPPLQQSQPHS